MALTVTIQSIRQRNGRVYIRFASGREYDFGSLAEFQQITSDIDEDTLEKVAMMMIRNRLPDITNPAALEGRGLRVDLSVNNWGTVI